MQVFEDVDAAAREYWRVTGGDPEELSRVLSALQKEYELMFIAGGPALAGWAAFKFV